MLRHKIISGAENRFFFAKEQETVKILPVIMCGGSGTRVWPESRESLPKQFISLIGLHSTFQMAAENLFYGIGRRGFLGRNQAADAVVAHRQHGDRQKRPGAYPGWCHKLAELETPGYFTRIGLSFSPLLS